MQATDLKYYLSGGAANADPNASLGGAISNTEIVGATLHNLFDKVTGDEAGAGDSEYRCFYVKNTHGTQTAEIPKTWVQTETPSADSDELIGLGTSAINGVEQTIVDESTAPVGVVFSQANGEGAGLSYGADLGPGDERSIWIQRDISLGATSVNADATVIRTGFDAPAD